MRAKAQTGRGERRADAPAGREAARPSPARAAADRYRAALGNRGFGALVAGASPPPAGDIAGTVVGRMERAFGCTFGDVQLRTDEAAARRAESLRALAYTDGREVGFARGAFAPKTPVGIGIIAHEFAHVVQARRGAGSGAAGPRDATERDADRASEAVAAGRVPEVAESARAGELQLKREEPGAGAVEEPEADLDLAPGTYLALFVEDAYRYRFRVDDVAKWPDAWREVARIHLAAVFPSAPAAVREAAVRSIADPQVKLLVDPAGAKVIEYVVFPELHARFMAWMQANHPEHGPVPPEEGEFALKPGAGLARRLDEAIGGTVIHFPSLPAEQHDRVMSVLARLLGRKGEGREELILSRKAIELLDQIAKSPEKEREEIIRRLTGGKPGGARVEGQTFEERLETAVVGSEVERARSHLGLDPFTGKMEEPIVPRPVHGEIVDRSGKVQKGHVVPEVEARFEFEVRDPVDAFRVPIVSILWVATPRTAPDAPVAREVTTYVPVRTQSFVNDRVFDLEFPAPGDYVVEAFVSHNFFLGVNHFTLPVTVVPEETLARRLLEDVNKGFVAPGTQGPGVTEAGVERARGKLAPGFQVATIEDQLQGGAEDRTRVEELRDEYQKLNTAEGRAVVKWATTYLERLEEMRKRLEVDVDAKPLGVRGAFASRAAGVPSSALSLLCYYRREGGRWTLVLNDFSQLAEPVDYRFEVGGSTIEEAIAAAFEEEAAEYPLGTLSVTFQDFDEAAGRPKDTYLTLTKPTDTVGKHVKAVLFGTVADLAVNFGAIVLMVIPGMQGVGAAIAISYNSAKTASEMAHKWAVGERGIEPYWVDTTQLLLNVVPLAGRGAKIVTVAGKTFYAVETISHAGNVLVMTAGAMQQVEGLRNGVIKELAQVESRIRYLRSSKGHPDLPGLLEQRRRLIDRGAVAMKEALATAFVQQSAQMVAQHVVMSWAERRVEVARAKKLARADSPEAEIAKAKEVPPAPPPPAAPPEPSAAPPAPAEPTAKSSPAVEAPATPEAVKPEGKVEPEAAKPASPAESEKAAGAPEPAAKEPAAKENAAKENAAKEPARKGDEPPAKQAEEEGPTATPEELEQAKISDVQPIGKEAPTEAAQEAAGEAEFKRLKDLEEKAEAGKKAYEAAVQRGYGRKKAKDKVLSESQWIERYQNDQYYEGKNWRPVKKAAGTKTVEPFPKGTTTAQILEKLAGKTSTSTFKPYLERLRLVGVSQAEVETTIDQVRARFRLDERPVSVDSIRHEIKRRHRRDILRPMFADADGVQLSAEASHQKMLELTAGLGSSDMGSIAEDWLHVARIRAAVSEAKPALNATPRQVVIREKDFPGIKKDRRLDRIEGDVINEVKRGDFALNKEEKAEVGAHLAMVGRKIELERTTVTVRRVMVTSLSPRGARANLKWMTEQMLKSRVLSWEVYNDLHERKVFSQDQLLDPATRKETGALKEFLLRGMTAE